MKLLIWTGRAAIRRHHQVLPGFGERRYVVRRGRTDYLVEWRKWKGLHVLAFTHDLHSVLPVPWTYFEPENVVPIKKPAFDTTNLSLPDLPSETKILAKFPTLVAFLTARSYEGGGARVPGKIWFEGDPSGFQLTLIDVDNAVRLAVRAPSIDGALGAAEVIIGAENAPWEVDQYQASRKASRSKKK